MRREWGEGRGGGDAGPRTEARAVAAVNQSKKTKKKTTKNF